MSSRSRVIPVADIRSAKNFALVLDDKEAPLNEPGEAFKLMKIIDGVYASAKTGRPVEL